MNSLSADVSAGGHLRSQAAGRAEAGSVVRLRVAIVVAGLVLGAALMLSAGTSAAPDGEDPRAGGPGSEAAGSTGAAALRSKFALANRCFALAPRAIRGFVGATADGYRVGSPQDAAAFYFKPTGLGTYMLSDQDGKLIGLGDPAVRADAPNQSAEWAATLASKRTVSFRSTVDRRSLAVEHKNLALVSVDGNAGLSGRFGSCPRATAAPTPRPRPAQAASHSRAPTPTAPCAASPTSISTSPPNCAPAARSSTAAASTASGSPRRSGTTRTPRRRRQRRRHRQPAARRAAVRHPRHARLADLRRLAGQRHEHAPAGLLRVAGADVEGGGAAGRCPGGRGPTDMRDRAAKGALL